MKWRAQRTSPNVSYLISSPLPTGGTEIAWQVTRHRNVFNGGCLPLIHGRITTSPMDCDTEGLGHGSFEETCSRNGKNPDRVHYYGSMGYVSLHPVVARRGPIADGFPPFIAGAGKSVLWCVNPSAFGVLFSPRTYDVGQFHHHSRDRGFAEMWSCVTGILLP